ncbi:uncharacterized protein LOC121244203 [Juglans microcarpa x Juglans regia]|uniref:uncharacterized protein LOC121244203 n=1 Tax=Juglans microcarpa x Juglans regia TaxID=2249226 RepID=UPI001B7D951C|nr:uncharacterized protein LOC121244203 [Juglans microcarpa x Juglans regia]
MHEYISGYYCEKGWKLTAVTWNQLEAGHKLPCNWQQWSKSRRGCNVDGSSFGNPGAAGGGIIRDSAGRALAGFAQHNGVSSNTVAEGRALLDGLRLAQQMWNQRPHGGIRFFRGVYVISTEKGIW